MAAIALAGAETSARLRLRLDVTGAVQGVGFRPFVYRLARSEGLSGFACNTGEGASLEIEGPAPSIARFLRRFDAEIRPPAAIASRRVSSVPPTDSGEFFIAPSVVVAGHGALVLPDLVTCAACLAELFDPADRRYLYPFTTCMQCGPRYSIIEAVPYDRDRTTMRHFAMCPACRAEYEDPNCRRFHAETNACAVCGPELSLTGADGSVMARGQAAFRSAVEALRSGAIVAVKGLGGFQLLADARNQTAVESLRRRKQRPTKPFAVMVRDLLSARGLAAMSPIEEETLCSAPGPIVLAHARGEASVLAPSVAPGSLLLGLMLPTTPLHHMLMRTLGFPVLATSGNRGDEPIVSDETEAPVRLAGLADLFLTHDRPIARPVDDSVVRVIDGEPTVLRLARGYAPTVFDTHQAGPPGLSVGGQQKGAVALDLGNRIVLGPHVGDLGSAETRAALDRSIEELTALYRSEPQWIACDAHPDYHSTRLARRLGPPVRHVPHHVAHVLAGCLDNGLDGPVLGVAWDGTGYGDDGTIWGSEFLSVADGRWRRRAHLMAFRLPGGDAAMRAPWRSALGALETLHGEAAFGMTGIPVVAELSPQERRVLQTMLRGGLNAPLTSSAGRLFDAVAALLGLCRIASFEGEAAMAVEYAAARASDAADLEPIAIAEGAGPIILDWRSMLASMVVSRRDGVSVERLALAFHHALADAIVTVAARAGIVDVLLTGGCFQNALLAGETRLRLIDAGSTVHLHRRIPPNDGGLAAGQAVFAARQMLEETS